MNIITHIIKGLKSARQKVTTGNKQRVVTVVPQHLHNIAQKRISFNALKVLNRLHNAGFDAYLVGGGVRDLLLKQKPKDFDVATNAHPEDVQRLFVNCRLIGRRFRLAHVFFGRDIVEVATFRAHHTNDTGDQDAKMHNGQIIRDNVYGKIDDDAQRRDFTINALYYNIADASIVDFSTGIADMEQQVIRLIGDPKARYLEDPIRILRAIRFAAKTGFAIEPKTEKPLFSLGELLKNVPQTRLFEEVGKLFTTKHALAAFNLLEHYGLFATLFPQTAQCLQSPEKKEGKAYQIYLRYRKVIEKTLRSTEQRVRQLKPVNVAFLFTALLWPALQIALDEHEPEHKTLFGALEAASNAVLETQATTFSIQKRITLVMQEIWRLQYQLELNRHRAPGLIVRSKFRAAYDFLVIRAQSGENHLKDIVKWWTAYQSADEPAKETLMASLPKRRRKQRHNSSKLT